MPKKESREPQESLAYSDGNLRMLLERSAEARARSNELIAKGRQLRARSPDNG